MTRGGTGLIAGIAGLQRPLCLLYDVKCSIERKGSPRERSKSTVVRREVVVVFGESSGARTNN